MRLFQVVLARIADVQDVCDLQCLDNAGVSCVVPVAEPKTAGQDFVRVVFSNRSESVNW
jgi:hypothetical protein